MDSLRKLLLKTYGNYDAPETFDFPVVKKPTVSLIIPVYNKFQMTRECLYSILKHTTGVPYEVIIADDCSTDETVDISKKIGGIRHIRTETNSGFGRNCTNAVKYACGKYIAFLNNDMLFYKNWLAPIIQTLEKDKSVGAAGATLIAPNGTVSELGGVISGDNVVVRIGRDCKYRSRLKKLNVDFDYKSGCCLVLDKKLWDRVGGFDPIFNPAYYEDTDLCFKIRKLGLRVVNVFQSRILHFETVSYGDKIMQTRDLCAQNAIKFNNKWHDVLSAPGHISQVQSIIDQYNDYLKKERRRTLFSRDGKTFGRQHIYFMGIKILSWYKKPHLCPNIIIPKKTGGKNDGVIYTCITGDYDDLIQPSCINKNYDYILFTDNAKYIKKKNVGVWKVRPLAFNKGGLAEINRWHKFHPHILFPDYQTSIYIDANINVKTAKLFDDIDKIPDGAVLSVPKHYKRDCIYEEIDAVAHYELDTDENLRRYKAFLGKEKFPAHYGLGENNVIWRRHHDKKCIKVMTDWWDVLQKYSKRDQLGLFYVLWKNKLKIPYLSDVNYRIDTVNFEFCGHKKKNPGKKIFASEV
ncbi:MAG: glycosyltransferase [Alphaproteobacteria bacterium]|nr:glycosyltransferase [Alphaproteobacteria bacterium]